MGAANGNGIIAVATSIPPALARQDAGREVRDYQAHCIQSWTGNGFHVISVNHVDDIPALAARYPQIRFVPASRDAREWTGRKTPYIADLLLALQEANEPVIGILNSDLLFEPSTAWRENLPSMVAESLVMAHRYNTNSLADGALRRFQGFDCFFFDKAMALCALENALPFAIGAPWWDYWFPCMALLRGRKVTIVDRPVTLHLFHKTAYSGQLQGEFGHHFANCMIRECQKRQSVQSDIFTALKPLLLEIADLPLGSEALKSSCMAFRALFGTEIRKNIVRWEARSGSDTSTNIRPQDWNGAFDRVEQRLAAGEAYLEIKALLAKKQAAAVGAELIAALNQAPDDQDVVLIQGETSLARKDFDDATAFFARAAELRPGTPYPLYRQGISLWASGRGAQALSLFQRAMEADPTHQPSCIAAARILSEARGPRCAIRFLDKVIARHPHLQQVAECRKAYRQARSPMGNKVRRMLTKIKSRFISR